MACVEYCPNCLHNVVCAIPVIDNLLGDLYDNPEDTCSCFMPKKTCKAIYGLCKDPICSNCLNVLVEYEKNFFGIPVKNGIANYCSNCGCKVEH